MGVEVSEEREIAKAKAPKKHSAAQDGRADAPADTRSGSIARILNELRSGFSAIEWRPVLMYGILAGLLMPSALLQQTFLSFLAGLIPVGTGLLVGRRVKGHYSLHGAVTGLIGTLVALVLLGVLIFLTPLGASAPTFNDPSAAETSLTQLWLTSSGFVGFSLIAFCIMGASMSGRTQERVRKAKEETSSRGGTLERPGVMRSADDIRGLSLPQLGMYVSNLFKRNGFQMKDYRFIDKDKHLDLWMEYNGEPWRLRLSVADKVSAGTIEGLNQELKREDCHKGVVITSTEFLPTAVKSAKGRAIVLIDGATLYEIAEK